MAQQEPVSSRRARSRFGTIVTALFAGFAGGLLAPLMLPRLERNLRPTAKSVIKTGIALYERGRERVAEIGEMTSDIMAEARAEYEAEQVMAGDTLPNEMVRLHNGHGGEAGAPNA